MTAVRSDLSTVAIIPVCNGARWIEQSIESVLAQTLAPDNFIVVVDGSTDHDPRVVERLAQSHPAGLLHKQAGSQSSARNFGVAHSKSALITLLDEDDRYLHHLQLYLSHSVSRAAFHWLGLQGCPAKSARSAQENGVLP